MCVESIYYKLQGYKPLTEQDIVRTVSVGAKQNYYILIDSYLLVDDTYVMLHIGDKIVRDSYFNLILFKGIDITLAITPIFNEYEKIHGE